MAKEFDKSTLKDPKQDRFAILNLDEVFDSMKKIPQYTSTFERNDGKQFRSPHNNPFYVLMTVAGLDSPLKNKEDRDSLRRENRRFWNGYVGQNFYDDNWLASARKKVGQPAWVAKDFAEYYASEIGISSSEFAPLTKAEKQKLADACRERCGSKSEIPKVGFDGINLRNMLFFYPPCFEKMLFLSPVDFQHCHFQKRASFGSSYFTGNVHFNNCYFGSSANFSSCNFFSPAFFCNSEFASETVFNNSRFASVAFFNDCRFKSWTVFLSCHFETIASFEEASFSSKTIFEGAKFKTHVPNFHAAELFSDTIFSAEEEDRHLWPTAKKHFRREWELPENSQGQSPLGAKSNYNVIRNFVAKKRLVEEEQFFHRREIEAQQVDAPWGIWLVYAVFGFFSNYGHSIGRPAAALAALFLIAFAICFQLPATKSYPITAASLTEPAGLALSNMFSYLGFTRLYYGDFLKVAPNWLQTVAGIQSFLAVVFQFLIGLGIRARFRLR